MNGISSSNSCGWRGAFKLSVNFLKEVDAVIDISQSKLFLNHVRAESPLIHLPFGHVAVDVLKFADGGWKLEGS